MDNNIIMNRDFENLNLETIRITKVFVTMNILTLFLGLFLMRYATIFKFLLLFINIIYAIFLYKNKFIMSGSKFLWIIFISIVMYGASKSLIPISALTFVFTLFLFFFNANLLESSSSWRNYYIKLLNYLVNIFVLGSIVQLVIPNMLIAIQPYYLVGTELGAARNFIYRNQLVGITNQIGVNGYILSIGAALAISRVFKTEDRKKQIFNVMYFIFLYSLVFLTNKTGFILFNLLIVLYIIIKVTKINTNTILLIILSLIMIYIFFFQTGIGGGFINSIIETGDVTSGRLEMYRIMWNNFIENPLLGVGTYETTNLIAVNHGHNIYLQVLSEQGLLGFIPFVLFLVINFFNTDRMIKSDMISREMRSQLILSAYLQLLFILWGVTGNTLYDNFPLYLYFIGIALLNSIYHEKEKKNEKS